MTAGASRRVLMVVFQFPPYDGSSAVQRALRFVQYLPAYGWEPVVLTANPRAYERVAADPAHEVPAGVHVERAFALDAKRHLAWRGKYPDVLARPDRWRTWQWGARAAGRRLIKRFRPSMLWSTYPIVSAHDIALHLAGTSGLPWIADFRDPMVEEEFPEEPSLRADFARRELAYSYAARSFTVTTPGMRDYFSARYPHLGSRGVVLIENGYDEDSFAGLEPAGPLHPTAKTIVHSGELYPVIRDPIHLFAATRRLIDRGVLQPGELRFRFRGSGDDTIVARAAEANRMGEYVEILPRVANREALREMLAADGLCILQGADCNRQIPAKVYEYLRSGRPVLGLTAIEGDTGRTLTAAGHDCIAPLDDEPRIERALERFAAQLRSGRSSAVRSDVVLAASRKARAGALAQLLDRIRAGAVH